MTDQNIKLLCKKKVDKKDKKLILESVEFTYFKKELTKILVNLFFEEFIIYFGM